MNIYVGNLASEVNEEDLRGIFETFGQVESVNILRDRRSGESKGFGFLRMPSLDEAKTAIKDADGTDLKGRAIKVNEAHPRPVAGPRRDNRGRGRPTGGGRDHRGGAERRGKPR
jgi:RNA recognition motif-containing protein